MLRGIFAGVLMGLAVAAGAEDSAINRAMQEAAARQAASIAQMVEQQAPRDRGLFNVIDAGAVGDGETDDTEAFQMALDACAKAGGGVVFAPTGRYAIRGNLRIPSHVTLEGVWRSPSSWTPADLGSVERGTVLLAYAGKGDAEGEPFIFLDGAATLKGVTIFHPEQIRSENPHPYPWTVAGEGDGCSILQVVMINPYQAVDFGTRVVGRHYINGLYAYALHKGLFINQCYDVGRIENVHFWPFWDLDPDSPLWKYTMEHGAAFIFGRTDGQMGTNLFCIFYSVGMHFIRVPLPTEEGRRQRYGEAAGVFTNCYLDVTPKAIQVDAVMSHAGISFVNGMIMSLVEVGPENRGPVKFTGTGFWSVREQAEHARIQGRGTVMFNSCHFSHWDRIEEGVACLDIDSAHAIITASEFESPRDDMTAVRIGPNVESAVVVGNRLGRGAAIDTSEADTDADLQIGFNTSR